MIAFFRRFIVFAVIFTVLAGPGRALALYIPFGIFGLARALEFVIAVNLRVKRHFRDKEKLDLELVVATYYEDKSSATKKKDNQKG